MDSASAHMYDVGGANVGGCLTGQLGGGGVQQQMHKSAQPAIKLKSLTPLTNANTAGHAEAVCAAAAGGNGELAELTSSEISLDLQGLIDDTHFGDDNLFGDLIEAKKHELNHGYGLPGQRASPAGSLGSSGQSSPESPQQYQYRNALAYLPGSVHSGATYMTNNNNNNNTSVQVKQEPQDHAHSLRAAASSHGSSFVSSTTPGGGPNGQAAAAAYPAAGSALPSLKSFATVPKYLLPTPAAIKKKMDRCSDDYRRRRERNNVAVRKSREKAKMRTRETEERVKILARENERMQKKVELLQEELAVLRSLFSNVGVLPEHIHRELSKHMDNFQQQHNAMGCM